MSQDYSIVRGEVVDTLQSWDLTDYYDACLCDPPYLLEFMGKAFDKQHKAMAGDNDGQRMYQWHLRWCREVYKVLKPGGFVLAFGGTRTSHRLACALEDAGFEVRDTIEYMYGSGFPKSHDISKGIDARNAKTVREELDFIKYLRSEKDRSGLTNSDIDNLLGLTTGAFHYFALSNTNRLVPPVDQYNKLKQILGLSSEWDSFVQEAEREKIGEHRGDMGGLGGIRLGKVGGDITRSILDESSKWSGYGTALKPAHEPIILAMKPCEGTFAENALEYGVAGLNIDECRIVGEPIIYEKGCGGGKNESNRMMGGNRENDVDFRSQRWENLKGRWPANLILQHCESCTDSACHPLCSVRLLDEQSGNRPPSFRITRKPEHQGGVHSWSAGNKEGFADSGGASRFFYQAKVSTFERNLGGIDCRHPTLKPIDLCRYLATLLLPPSRPNDARKLLIPFSGAGSEVAGSLLAGWDDVTGIEQDAEYVQWSEARVQAVLRGELQEKRSGGRPRQRRGRSTGGTGGTVGTVDTVDTSALADLFTEG